VYLLVNERLWCTNNVPCYAIFSVTHFLQLSLHKDFPHHSASKHSKFMSFPLSKTKSSRSKQNNWKNNFFTQLLNPYSDVPCNTCKMHMFTIFYWTVPHTKQRVHGGTKTSNTHKTPPLTGNTFGYLQHLLACHT
jgi:hypothetical protein